MQRHQYTLGECYYWGNGVLENREEAVKWYEKAAENYNADAQYSLGFCYERGMRCNCKELCQGSGSGTAEAAGTG